jgi:hypothetical protein
VHWNIFYGMKRRDFIKKFKNLTLLTFLKRCPGINEIIAYHNNSEKSLKILISAMFPTTTQGKK